MTPVVGRVKWFNQAKGFGFIVPDDQSGDVLIHRNALRDHGLTSLPEGAEVKCMAIKAQRGLQARIILGIDLTNAQAFRPQSPPSCQRVERNVRADQAGGFERVLVKWYSARKGFGFVVRAEAPESGDIFVHAEAVRAAGLSDLTPSQSHWLEARVAPTDRGPSVIELRIGGEQ